MSLKIRPIWLKYAMRECGIRQEDMADMLGYTRQGLGHILKGGSQISGPFFMKFYKFLAGNTQEAADLRAWSARKSISPEGLFLPWEPGPRPAGAETEARIFRTQMQKIKTGGIMISIRTMKHFGLKRNPFANEISGADDIFMSEDHHFIFEMMMETGRYAGFTAVVGEVGSGKSTIRKRLVKQMRDETIQLIFPQILDKRKITAGSLLDSVIMDISEEIPKQTMEAKTRQAMRLLTARSQTGLRQVLVLEESHLLNNWALKHLKQIHEFENGYRKLLGIILIGQPELGSRLDESQHPQLREVIRRVTVAEIEGLGQNDVKRYLAHKITRIKGDPERVFSPDAADGLWRRLQSDDGAGGKINRAYPLSVNNAAAMAMNRTADFGEERVTTDIIMNL